MNTLPCADLGSARVWRVGFGVAPKQSFLPYGDVPLSKISRKVRDGEGAIASTRDARAPRIHDLA
jgi:hypothetical protein